MSRVVLDPPGVRVLLLDIEGTTTSVRFVYDVLFPHARARMEEFLRTGADTPEVRDDVRALREEHAREEEAHDLPPWDDHPPDGAIASAVRYAFWLMDRDRKSTALKSLQGRIWEGGYRSGEIVSHVYRDVAPALSRWRRQGRSVAIFSSGSVLAQRLLFTHTPAGDLTPFFEACFDTTMGSKRDPSSYRGIGEALGAPPAAVLFVSDVVEELDAARLAGLWTALCVRHEATTQAVDHAVVHGLDEIYP